MPSVSSLTRPDLVEATAEIGGEKIVVQFDRNKVTLKWLSAVQEAQAGLDALAIARVTAEVLHSWDVVNDDGTPYPLTADNLATLPASVLGALSEAVGEASAPSSAEGNALPPSVSEPQQDSASMSESSPNGSAGSTSQNVSASPSLT